MENISIEAVKDYLIKMFESLKPEAQKDYWNDFLSDLDLDTSRKYDTGFHRAINTNDLEFWESFECVCEDNHEIPEVEAIRMASFSPHYSWKDKYVRYGWDEELKECTLVSGNTVLELIESWDGVPLYKTNEFIKYFGEQILAKLGIASDDITLS